MIESKAKVKRGTLHSKIHYRSHATKMTGALYVPGKIDDKEAAAHLERNGLKDARVIQTRTVYLRGTNPLVKPTILGTHGKEGGHGGHGSTGTGSNRKNV